MKTNMGKYTKPDALSQFAQICIKVSNAMERLYTYGCIHGKSSEREICDETGMSYFLISAGV